VRITRNQAVSSAKVELAKRLRRTMTFEERTLWRVIRNNALAGLHFRRQQVIEGFIVDFYCACARLVIEVDAPFTSAEKSMTPRGTKHFPSWEYASCG
jgi:very-short-patch-repair endonuclease